MDSIKSNYEPLRTEKRYPALGENDYQPLLPKRDEQFSKFSFVYSEDYLDCVELSKYCENNLPTLARVETGFMGQDLMHCYGKGEELRIGSIIHQQRAIFVGKEENSNSPLTISIPILCDPPYKFRLHERHKIDQKNQKFESLASILGKLTSHQLQNSTFEYEKQKITYQKGVSEFCTVKINRLNYYHSYDLRYMIINSFTTSMKEGLTRESFAIPCYMPIKFAIAQTINTGDEIDLNTILYNLERQAFQIDHSKVNLNDAILRFTDFHLLDGAERIYHDYDRLHVEGFDYQEVSMIPAADYKYLDVDYIKIPPLSILKNLVAIEEDDTPPPIPPRSYKKSAPTPSNTFENDLHNYINGWEDLPTDRSTLTVDQVSMCLSLLKLDKYIQKFRELSIDGRILSQIPSTETFIEEFGMTRLESVKLIEFSKNGWTPIIYS